MIRTHMSNYAVNSILLEWYNASHSPHPIQFKCDKGEVFIYTPNPGYLIGKAGNLYYKYEKKFQEKFKDFTKITLVEVQRVYEVKHDIMEGFL